MQSAGEYTETEQAARAYDLAAIMMSVRRSPPTLNFERADYMTAAGKFRDDVTFSDGVADFIYHCMDDVPAADQYSALTRLLAMREFFDFDAAAMPAAHTAFLERSGLMELDGSPYSGSESEPDVYSSDEDE